MQEAAPEGHGDVAVPFAVCCLLLGDSPAAESILGFGPSPAGMRVDPAVQSFIKVTHLPPETPTLMRPALNHESTPCRGTLPGMHVLHASTNDAELPVARVGLPCPALPDRTSGVCRHHCCRRLPIVLYHAVAVLGPALHSFINLTCPALLGSFCSSWATLVLVCIRQCCPSQSSGYKKVGQDCLCRRSHALMLLPADHAQLADQSELAPSCSQAKRHHD